MIISTPTTISIHTPLAGSDPPSILSVILGTISIHTPLAGSDKICCNTTDSTYISIHTPLAGSDRAFPLLQPSATYFNPHSPCGEFLCCSGISQSTNRFQSTLPLRGVTGGSGREDALLKFQSTLPLRGVTLFSITCRCAWIFQSTLPLRGVTCRCVVEFYPGTDFNPHSPCGE